MLCIPESNQNCESEVVTFFPLTPSADGALINMRAAWMGFGMVLHICCGCFWPNMAKPLCTIGTTLLNRFHVGWLTSEMLLGERVGTTKFVRSYVGCAVWGVQRKAMLHRVDIFESCCCCDPKYMGCTIGWFQLRYFINLPPQDSHYWNGILCIHWIMLFGNLNSKTLGGCCFRKCHTHSDPCSCLHGLCRAWSP